jgi:receptor expression-enhancing protein 1/2/3/4
VEPYLVQNESDIDASIASARTETLQFLQSRLATLWDIVYSLLSRTPVTSKLSPSGVTSANGSHPADQITFFQSVQDAWSAINSPVFAAPTPGSGKPTVSRSVSDTVASEKQAPSHAPLTDVSSTVGYDVGENTRN